MTCVQTDDFSPSQIGDSRTRMSAAMTFSKIAGQPSRVLAQLLLHLGEVIHGPIRPYQWHLLLISTVATPPAR